MKYNASNYYYDGYAAYTNGLSHDQCQLEMGTTSRVDWYRGWRDAERDNREKSSPSEIDSSNQQFESLATKQDEGWSGGIPPVSTECEIFDCEKWLPVRIKYVGDYLVVVRELDGSLSERVFHIAKHPDKFRPIRTEADRKREEAINEIASLVGRGTFCDDAAGIYDAIAAGKIPNIKLESPHE